MPRDQDFCGLHRASQLPCAAFPLGWHVPAMATRCSVGSRSRSETSRKYLTTHPALSPRFTRAGTGSRAGRNSSGTSHGTPFAEQIIIRHLLCSAEPQGWGAASSGSRALVPEPSRLGMLQGPLGSQEMARVKTTEADGSGCAPEGAPRTCEE